MTYDPNYHYNEDEDQDMQDDEDEGGWGSDYFDDDQDDDDDTAWKVRKASIKIIDAVVTCCQSELNDYWLKYADLLSRRFIERDDNVKLDLLKTFQNLINTAIIKDNEYLNPNSKRVHPFASRASELYPQIIKNLLKQYNTKNLKVKVEITATLSILAPLMEDQLENYLSQILPHIEQSVNENNNDLLLYSLAILKYAFSRKAFSITAQKESQKIAKFLLATMNQNQSKIVAESLKVAGLFMLQLQDQSGSLNTQFQGVAQEIFKGIIDKLQK